MDDEILEKIYKSSLKFLVPLNLDATYKIITNEAIKLVGADSGAIYLERDGEFIAAYASLMHHYKIKPRKRANTYKAFSTRKPVIADISNIQRAHPQVRNLGLKSAIFIPLINQRKAIGVLALNSKKEHYFTQKTLKVLVIFGSMVSLAIRKAQLFQETKEALETRDLFISMASHELKTPLTAVNGYIQLLQTKLDARNNEEGRWIRQLSWEALRLTHLIKELLTIEQIKKGSLHYNWSECNLKTIVERALSDFSFTHEENKACFINKTDGACPIIGDSDKLLQMVTNLLDNAATASPRDKEILVTLSAKGKFYFLEVKDNGAGIPKKEIAKIFNKYQRGSNNTREGMGLGLFLVKDIITKHRGSIKAKSKINKGTTIQVKLQGIKL